jgi:hypothetical protein
MQRELKYMFMFCYKIAGQNHCINVANIIFFENVMKFKYLEKTNKVTFTNKLRAV